MLARTSASMPKSTSKPIPNLILNPTLTRTLKTARRSRREAYVEKSTPRSLRQEATSQNPEAYERANRHAYIEKPSQTFKAPFRAAQSGIGREEARRPPSPGCFYTDTDSKRERKESFDSRYLNTPTKPQDEVR